MERLNDKLGRLAAKVENGEPIHVAIFGLGSVGHYLLEYLLAQRDPQLRLFVAGRSREKLVRDVNISRIAGLIRGASAAEVEMVDADFSSVDSTATAIRQVDPDVLVNSSRAYSGLKYGSISWSAIRAYGIWAPLSVKYVKTIMAAHAEAGSSAIVINTSYADATNAWLRTAGLAYPDFGSGNLNHLVPRIKLGVADLLNLTEPGEIENIGVTLATSHFHDVAISKEGTTEGVDPLLEVTYRGERIELDAPAVYQRCAIEMPVDQKRNMMNASSNFEIIMRTLAAIRTGAPQVVHVPGFDGLIGGYPVVLELEVDRGASARVLETPFSLQQMVEHNRESIFLDGIAGISDGVLSYTPQLAEKVQEAFGYELPRSVPLDESDAVATELIEKVIRKHT
jgi:hypothetical protein